jgi:hypothetical protein
VTGKIIGIIILVTALLAGGGMYYLQVYHFYETVEPTGAQDVQLTSLETGEPEPLPHEGFRAIDAASSPIRYRACFTTQARPAMLSQTFEPYPEAEPLVAPGWFECFDADALGAALEEGRARAFLGQKNLRYGIDRVVAVTREGRGYVWHQINHCGEVVFDGRPAPADCPEPPEGYQ